MKKIKSLLFAVCALAIAPLVANAAPQLTIYYSPTCPHCHDALNFIHGTLVKESPDLIVTEINASDPKNNEAFFAALKKCNFTDAGVPLTIINGKCIQGYADPMANDYRVAVRDMGNTDAQAEDATANNAPVADNAATTATNTAAAPITTKSHFGFYALIAIIIIAAGFVAFAKRKKK